MVKRISPCVFQEHRSTTKRHLHTYLYMYVLITLMYLQVVLNDVVSVCPEAPDEPLYIARIIRMWEDNNGKKMFHGWWFRYETMYMTDVYTCM